MAVPTEIRLSPDKQTLRITFPQHTCTLGAAHLRRNSPSAEVKGHFGHGGTPPSITPDLHITSLEPVGNYALKIIFSDGHATGLYTWDYLQELSDNTT